MLKKMLLYSLLGLLGLCTPLKPGKVVTVKAVFKQYACAPCASAEAFAVTQVYDPAEQYLLNKDIIFYYEGDYLRENNQLCALVYDPQVGCSRPVRILCKLQRRSLFDKLTGAMCEADAYKVACQ